MKVVIVGINRSATTAVTQLFAQKYLLLNYGEIFLDHNNRVPPDALSQERTHAQYIINLLQTSADFVCKIMPAAFVPHSNNQSMVGVDYQTFDFSMFDKIIFTRRTVVDQVASILSVNTVFLSHVKSQQDSIPDDTRLELYKNFSGPVDVSDGVFDSLQKQFEIYRGVRDLLFTTYPDKCATVTYEMLQQDPAVAMSQFSAEVHLPFTATDYLSLTTQKTQKNYQAAIANYNALVAQVHKYNLHY